MITVTQLRAFVAVARFRNFTRAAEDLQVAQPSVSYQIHELERVVGARLVEIVGRRVFITDAGERLATRAAALLNDVEDVEREMRDYGAGIVGRLRLGATRTIGGYVLPGVLAGFHREHPRIDLHLTIHNTRRIEELLLERSIDLGVVEGRVTSLEILSRPLRRDALVLVVPPTHPFARRSSVIREDLRGQPFISRESGSGTRALAEEAIGPVAREITPVLELDEPEAIVRAVEAGLGLAFISESIVTGPVAAGTVRVVAIDGVDLARDFSLVSLRDRPSSPSMRLFADFITRTWASG